MKVLQEAVMVDHLEVKAALPWGDPWEALPWALKASREDRRWEVHLRLEAMGLLDGIIQVGMAAAAARLAAKARDLTMEKAKALTMARARALTILARARASTILKAAKDQ